MTLQEIVYEGGMKMLRLRIKEGKRFTDLELDAQTLKHITESLADWIVANEGNS